MAKITDIYSDSVVRGQVEIGDEVLSFNGRPFEDILDYIYADSLDKVEMQVKGKDGETREVAVNKRSDFYSLGLAFDESVEITPRECKNNCIFCFVRQLPKNLRKTLYVRDDDYRLSVISGCYITCTNLSEGDIERIISYRLSPLYISVHATDPELRKFMLGVKKEDNQLATIKRLTENCILIHAQIVLVGGVNDGEALKKTLQDLWDANVATVAVVPVGLTCHREGLHPISPLTKEQAQAAIELVEQFYTDHEMFCYCSDEMYQIAGKACPGFDYYGSFDQIENGVGLTAKFFFELEDALTYAPDVVHKKVGVFTGVSGLPAMKRVKKILEEKWSALEFNIYPVINTFFGETVTVTGLVTATDIIKSYGAKAFAEDFLIIPSVMLKEFETVFLDNKSVDDLSQALNKKIVVSEVTGDGLVRVLTEDEDEVIGEE